MKFLNIKFISICIILSICFSMTRKNDSNSKYALQHKVYNSNHKNFNLKSLNYKPRKMQNLNWIKTGYNLAKANPFNILAQSIIDPGFTIEIFKDTYNENRITPDGKYLIPDGWDIKDIAGCSIGFTSSTINTESKLTNDMMTNLGLEISSVKYSFGMNAEYKKMKTSINKEEYVYITNIADCPVYKANIIPHDMPAFSKHFEKALNTLTGKTFENNKQKFYNLIDSYGTHYLHDVEMGSKYSHLLEISNKEYEKMSSNQIDVSANAKVLALASLTTNVKNSNESSSLSNISNSKEYKKSLGKKMPNDKDLHKWESESSDKPMPIKFSIKKISELLENTPYENIKIELDKALDSYCEYLLNKGLIASCDLTVKIKIDSTQKYTTNNDNGNGSIFYLDRHDIVCGNNSAINSFILENGSGGMNYKYNCIETEYISNKCYQERTSVFDVHKSEKKSLDILNNFVINCKDNYALRRIKLDRIGRSNSIYYSFQCCEITKKSCYSKQTDEQVMNSLGTSELAKLNMSAENKNVIYGFRIVIVDGRGMGMNFNFLKGEIKQCALE